MNKNSKIYIAGHQGMVGSALARNLRSKGYSNIIGKTLEELDLRDQLAVKTFFETEKPEYVFLAAAKVGGIIANNTYRAEFIYDNLQIQNNIIHYSYLSGVKKLLFLGSSCIYPKDSPQPMKEEYLLSGYLEKTNEPYAIAKIAGLKMCESYFRQYGCNFISVMPTSLYGPNDNYDLEKSHVLPALIRKIHLGKCLENNNWPLITEDIEKNPISGISKNTAKNEVIKRLSEFGIHLDSKKKIVINLWGTGNPLREFLHVNDMADACVYVLESVDGEKLYNQLKQTHINIGTGIDISIKELAEKVKGIIGFNGEIKWDSTKPDGTFKKQLDVDLLKKLNWNNKINLKEGIIQVYENYSNTGNS